MDAKTVTTLHIKVKVKLASKFLFLSIASRELEPEGRPEKHITTHLKNSELTTCRYPGNKQQHQK